MPHHEVYLQKRVAAQSDVFFSIRRKDGPLGEHFESTLHWHDYCELEIITGGNAEHRLNGVSYPVSRGDVYLLTPKDLHTLVESPQNPVLLYNLNFDEQTLPPPLRQALFSEELPLLAHLEEEELRVCEALLLQICEEYHSNRPHRSLLLTSLFSRLTVLLLRHRSAPKISPEASSVFADPIRRSITYLKEHFREPISLTSCATAVYLSPGYLGELFFQTTGVRFKDYLNRLRFECAVKLLSTTELSVAEISRASGFSSPSYFIASFRKKYGKTPSEVRKQPTP